MFPGMGTTLNIITIIIGGGLGVFIGTKINQKLRDLILDALGCVTIISAADALMDFGIQLYKIQCLAAGLC